MKVKIESFNGELPSYLTVGKEYVVKSRGAFGFWIVTDNLMESYVLLNDCCLLNGGSWEVVNE